MQIKQFNIIYNNLLNLLTYLLQNKLNNYELHEQVNSSNE
jgi:hypothetical protein